MLPGKHGGEPRKREAPSSFFGFCAVKIDFKKQIESYSAPWGGFSIVTVAVMQFLMTDDHGSRMDDARTLLNSAGDGGSSRLLFVRP